MCQPKRAYAKKSTFCMFRGQKTAATSYRTTRLFLLFMTNLLIKQPERGSNVKWGSSKTSLCLSVHFRLPKEMGHVGRFLYTPIYLAAKNGNWQYIFGKPHIISTDTCFVLRGLLISVAQKKLSIQGVS